jgi:hypothetical protein
MTTVMMAAVFVLIDRLASDQRNRTSNEAQQNVLTPE